ncbi:hypothetical protein GWK47_054660 [Chionoecetes opilio]|uniref:Uncharacterized protein n=1 Tax=Chionoecetes opilio TaxID=41210 RepID=A0A8J5CPV1_CHIOP|nr:hypothetical protein GWK47_054660 [Chionoecetes opilio]
MSCSVRDVEGGVKSTPPCEDCLFMHALRANYQAAIWRRSLQSQPFVRTPKDCGWMTDEDGKLAVNWMRGSPAPDAVMQLLSCKCVRSCELPKCTCLSNGPEVYGHVAGYRHARTRLLKKSR